MVRLAITAVAALLASACGGSADTIEADAPAGPEAATQAEAADPASEWDLLSSGEGVALLFGSGGHDAIRLFCPAGERQLLVNVPSFRPIGSEERLSFGGGGEVVALVADTRGDRQRGGVSGTGAVPSELGQILSGPVSASYGAQASGPHPAPPTQLARAFAGACAEGGSAPEPRPERPSQPELPRPASACREQDGRPIPANALRAIGTEPFWGARIEGRCVTYSHPDDQAGTRVWTRFSGSRDNGTWSGALEGRRFELRTRPQPGCSDGMSDNRYPIAVELIVHGERRTGCAERL